MSPKVKAQIPASRRRLLVRAAVLLVLIAVVAALVSIQTVQAADKGFSGVEIRFGGGTEKDKLSTPLQVMLLLTILSVIPAILVSVTSFTRLIIVSHF